MIGPGLDVSTPRGRDKNESLERVQPKLIRVKPWKGTIHACVRSVACFVGMRARSMKHCLVDKKFQH